VEKEDWKLLCSKKVGKQSFNFTRLIVLLRVLKDNLFKKNALKFQSFENVLEQMEDLHHEFLSNV